MKDAQVVTLGRTQTELSTLLCVTAKPFFTPTSLGSDRGPNFLLSRTCEHS